MSGWVTDRDGAALVVSRHGRLRLDVVAETVLPGTLRKGRVAHAVRQDLWRALQRVRGFSPVVRVEDLGGSLRVCAGGQVDGAMAPGLAGRIVELLEAQDLRARWITWGRR